MFPEKYFYPYILKWKGWVTLSAAGQDRSCGGMSPAPTAAEATGSCHWTSSRHRRGIEEAKSSWALQKWKKMAFRTLFILCRGGPVFDLTQGKSAAREWMYMHLKIALTDLYLQWKNQIVLWSCYERWVRSLRSPFLSWQKDPHCPGTVSQSTETNFFPVGFVLVLVTDPITHAVGGRFYCLLWALT